jgi:hypothetical protein
VKTIDLVGNELQLLEDGPGGPVILLKREAGKPRHPKPPEFPGGEDAWDLLSFIVQDCDLVPGQGFKFGPGLR